MELHSQAPRAQGIGAALVEVGAFCSIYQDCVLRYLNTKRVEADEIWAFVGAKARNAKKDGQGDLWTLHGVDAESKLMLSWLVGPRSSKSTQAFMANGAERLGQRVQLSTDGLSCYIAAVENAFGWNGVPTICRFLCIVTMYQSARQDLPLRSIAPLA